MSGRSVEKEKPVFKKMLDSEDGNEKINRKRKGHDALVIAKK